MEGRYVAALHCGWRGNAGNFPANAVRKFCAQYQVDLPGACRARPERPQSEFVNFSANGTPFRPYFDPQTQRVDL